MSLIHAWYNTCSIYIKSCWRGNAHTHRMKYSILTSIILVNKCNHTNICKTLQCKISSCKVPVVVYSIVIVWKRFFWEANNHYSNQCSLKLQANLVLPSSINTCLHQFILFQNQLQFSSILSSDSLSSGAMMTEHASSDPFLSPLSKE